MLSQEGARHVSAVFSDLFDSIGSASTRFSYLRAREKRSGRTYFRNMLLAANTSQEKSQNVHLLNENRKGDQKGNRIQWMTEPCAVFEEMRSATRKIKNHTPPSATNIWSGIFGGYISSFLECLRSSLDLSVMVRCGSVAVIFREVNHRRLAGSLETRIGIQTETTNFAERTVFNLLFTTAALPGGVFMD